MVESGMSVHDTKDGLIKHLTDRIKKADKYIDNLLRHVEMLELCEDDEFVNELENDLCAIQDILRGKA